MDKLLRDEFKRLGKFLKIDTIIEVVEFIFWPIILAATIIYISVFEIDKCREDDNEQIIKY